MPNLFVIGGCNGAGKTTASLNILPEILDCKEFVNADTIAYGLNPLMPESVAFEAGKIFLNRINELISERKDFAVESTLASKSLANIIHKARKSGYKINLIYFWLQNYEIAIKRVAERVKLGGHNIPEEVILRRYYRGINNFFEIYCKISDYWIVIDNTFEKIVYVAEGNKEIITELKDNERWDKLINIINDNK
jgi:predicted ABC-type ATPase